MQTGRRGRCSGATSVRKVIAAARPGSLGNSGRAELRRSDNVEGRFAVTAGRADCVEAKFRGLVGREDASNETTTSYNVGKRSYRCEPRQIGERPQNPSVDPKRRRSDPTNDAEKAPRSRRS